MSIRTRFAAVAALLSITALGACDREGQPGITEPDEPVYSAMDSTFATNPGRRFTQLERLANPLVMEVFVEKREHDTYNAYTPTGDPLHFTDDLVYFVTTVAGRSPEYGRAIAAALLGTPESNPGDKLTVFTGRAPGVTAANVADAATVGWLTHALNPTAGYGGRKLMNDDAVDKGTAVAFGAVLGNTNNVSPGLVGDNVPANDKAHAGTFPYVAAPTQ